MFPLIIKTSFILCLIPILGGCSKNSSSSYRYIRAGRITTQQGHSVVLHPQIHENPIPDYHWSTPKQSVITFYSFHCKGALHSLEINQEDTLYDCNGLSHSLGKSFFIHPKIVAITRLLHQHYHVSIVEGFCCPKHFKFLKASGIGLSPKHLTGHAALLRTSQTLSAESLRPLLRSLYNKKSAYPCSIELTSTSSTISNEEFFITTKQLEKGTELSIEILYDIDHSQPITNPQIPM